MPDGAQLGVGDRAEHGVVPRHDGDVLGHPQAGAEEGREAGDGHEVVVEEQPVGALRPGG